MLPVRCNCNKVIGHLGDRHQELLKRHGLDRQGLVLDELGLTRDCCREIMMQHTHYYDEVNWYDWIATRRHPLDLTPYVAIERNTRQARPPEANVSSAPGEEIRWNASPTDGAPSSLRMLGRRERVLPQQCRSRPADQVVIDDMAELPIGTVEEREQCRERKRRRLEELNRVESDPGRSLLQDGVGNIVDSDGTVLSLRDERNLPSSSSSSSSSTNGRVRTLLHKAQNALATTYPSDMLIRQEELRHKGARTVLAR